MICDRPAGSAPAAGPAGRIHTVVSNVRIRKLSTDSGIPYPTDRLGGRDGYVLP
jgi:hypothetical protein